MSTGVRCIASVMVFAWFMVMPALAGAWPWGQDQASPVLLTDVISSGGDALRQAAGEGDIGMLVDAQNLSLSDAHAVVFAVEDAQAAGRDVIAIVDADLEDGSAVVAAACQGMVMVGDVSLTGCGESWCGSPSRRASLAAQLAQSGGRDRAIAERLLGGTSALSYSPTQGVQSAPAQGGAGSIALAQQGKPMKLNAAALQAIGWSGQPQADVASAMAAIVAGQVKTQPKVPPRSSGAGSPPPPPSGKTSSPPPPPGGKTAPPPPPAGALPPAASKKLQDIQADLASLKKDIEKFNRLFTGEDGVWDQKSKGLREVWNTGEMTKHQPTKKDSSDLQDSMRTKASRIERNIRGIKGAAKGVAIPQQAQLKALEDILRTFQASLATDDPDKYSRSSAQVMSTTIK
jgi:hypothetical protein